MGSDRFAVDRPVHTVQLDAYCIDKYEVTNELYQAYVRASETGQPFYARNSRFNAPQQPVVGVTWFDAQDYCSWAGMRLPTEAEWEKAARGTDGRAYPWGEDITSANANFGADAKVDATTAVGSFPDGVSPYGAHDLGGNVWEWVADWFDDRYYESSPASNPSGPPSGTKRAQRGARGSRLQRLCEVRAGSRWHPKSSASTSVFVALKTR